MSFTNRALRRKTLKNVGEGDEVIRNKLVKYFSMMGKEQLGEKELKSVLLCMGYHSQEIKQLLYNYNLSKGIGGDNYLYKIGEVYQMCEKNVPKEKWKKQCFDLFSSDKNCVTLEDLQVVRTEISKTREPSITHKNLEEIIEQFGTNSSNFISQVDFDRLLQVSNIFNG